MNASGPRTGRLIALIALVGSLSLAAAAQAQSTPAPSLSGENLTEFGTAEVTSADCEEGPIGVYHGTFSYEASGTAAGPYSGTFHETGTVTISDSPSQTNDVVGFTAEFTIDSPLGLVTGTKTLGTEDDPLSQGICSEPEGPTGGFQTHSAGFSNARYTATITFEDGSKCTDSGSAIVGFNHNLAAPPSGPRLGEFQEIFASDNPDGCIPTLPTSKDDCKKGGWKRYGVFKNQGDCVSFVASDGKNKPAGP